MRNFRSFIYEKISYLFGANNIDGQGIYIIEVALGEIKMRENLVVR